jgi:hypothetical protein
MPKFYSSFTYNVIDISAGQNTTSGVVFFPEVFRIPISGDVIHIYGPSGE